MEQREKNESMSSKSMEEEREGMKQELLDMGMYEPWYSYEEMKQILGFISESKDMANMANDERNSRKESLHRSNERSATEGATETNLPQELDRTDSSSCRVIRTCRTNESFYQERADARVSGSTSPESICSGQDSEGQPRRKSGDNGEQFDRDVKDNSQRSGNKRVSSSLRLRNLLQESQWQVGEMETEPEQNQKLDRWRMNPLKSRVTEEEVPLQQPERRIIEDREPFRSCKEAWSNEPAVSLDKVLLALNHHLRRMAELWYTWNHRSATVDSKLQWGSPIQVGTSNDSLDRKPLIGYSRTEPSQGKQETINQERSSNKRKLISTGQRISSDEDSQDEDSPVGNSKKQRMRSKSPCNRENPLRSRSPSRQTVTVQETEQDEIGEEVIPVPVQAKNNEAKKLSLDEPVVPEPRYPRRIVPPIPKSSFSGPRKRKVVENSAKSTTKTESQEQSSTGGESMNGGNCSQEKSDVEIKPLKLKNLSVRLERECMALKLAMQERQKQLEEEREEARRKEEEEKKKKEETARRHMEEVQLRYRQKEEARKWVKEKSTRWNDLLRSKAKENKEKSRVLREEDTRVAEMEIEEENRLLEDSDLEIEEDTTNIVNCPICDEPFPNHLIEAHAATCEQYTLDTRGTSNPGHSKPTVKRKPSRKSEMLECNICSMFKTTNGIEYEDHVNSCMQRQSASQDCSSGAIHEVPSSPIRCFRPISEQTDSDIDYRAQFGTTSNKTTRPNRKRKR